MRIRTRIYEYQYIDPYGVKHSAKISGKDKKNAISFAKFCHSDSCKIIISKF